MTVDVAIAPLAKFNRAISLGSQQAVKQLFVLGEQGLGEGIARPELNGIFLGNTPLDAIYVHLFAFYWKRHRNRFARIKASNLAYVQSNAMIVNATSHLSQRRCNLKRTLPGIAAA